MKKIVSLLLVLAMLISVLPLQVFASAANEVQAGSASPANTPETLTIVNPEYAHLVSEDDIAQTDPTIYSKLDYGSNYLPEDEAAAVVREAMKKRETTIAVDFYTNETDPNKAPFAALYSAMVHTGNPTEGDYLHKHYKKCSVSYYSSTGTVDDAAVTQISATYMVTYMSDASQEAEMDTAVAALLKDLNVWCADDYTKFMAVYDYICDNITYDYDNLNNAAYHLKHSAYAALVNKTAVCQGYALLLYRLMLELGIDCRYISGDSGGAHGWNIVKLDGKYYNVDSTWDAGYSTYRWCLLSQETFTNHLRDTEYDTAEFHSAYPMGTANYVYSGDGSLVHSYTAVVTLPTCTAQGYTTYTCQGCKDSYIADYKAAAHNYVDGVCSACSNVQTVASGTCGDNLTWTLDAAGTLTISGTGKMDDYDYGTAPWYEKLYSIKTVVIENGVTSIGSWAFSDCFWLTSVTIPDSVATIGNFAFFSCIGLTSVKIPNSVTSIGLQAFIDCTSLTSVTIPNSVTYIGDSAFSNCTALTGIWVDANNTAYSSDSYGVLFDKNKTKLIQAPRKLSGSYTIPGTVTTIGYSAFYGCTGLTSVTIPDSVTTVDGFAFSNCTGLTGIGVDANNTAYSSDSYGVLFDKNKTKLIQAPGRISGSYTIPGTVTAISDYAFYSCTGLTSVTIPDGVATIGSYAFFLCTGLTSVEIPNSVTTIGGDAFSNCTGLTSVTIGDGVITIGNTAFYWCTDLTSVAFPDSVATIGTYAFSSCTSLTTVIYCGTQAQWDAISIDSGNDPLTNATLQFHNYVNGLCTICQYKDLVKISGASLVLQSNLAINYKVNKVLFEEYGFTNPYLVVEMNGVKTTITDYYVDGDKYVFAFRNIAPNQMNDTAVATFYATYDGTEYASAARDYSVATYAYNTLGKNIATELKTLLVDLLHYGAASQTYTSYRTDALVNASLTDEQLTWGTSQDPVLENVLNTKYETVENPTAKWKGAGLYLQDAVAIRLTLEAADITGLSVKITNDNDQTWTIPATQFQSIGDNKYYVYFTGLDAGQMRQSVYLTICNGDTPVSNTARYSICSYAESKQNATDTNLVDLLKAMMKYGDSAYAYAN